MENHRLLRLLRDDARYKTWTKLFKISKMSSRYASFLDKLSGLIILETA